MDKDIERYFLYYADLFDTNVSKIIRNGISSEAEAQKLLNFIDVIYRQSILDMEQDKIVLGELASIKDADKASLVLTMYLKEIGYKDLVDKWILNSLES